MRIGTILALAISIVGIGIARCEAQAVYAKVADEWGTIQSSGPRTGVNGVRFWNIEGAGNGSFASTGTLRFYMSELKGQLDTDFGAGQWKVDNITLVVEQQNAAFTADGLMNIFHVTNDSVGFTNGSSDGSPGDFSALGVSPLFFDSSSPASTGGASLGTVTLVNEYNYVEVGGFDNADAFGQDGNAVDPSGAVNAGPTYGIVLPDATVSPFDEVSNLNNEIANDSSAWIAGGMETLIADIEDGTDALSLIFAPGDDAVAATYKGNFFIDSLPPRLYIEVSPLDSTGLTGDYNGDDIVDAADYTVWRDKLGSATPLTNETASLGTVDIDDYDAWKGNFGALAGSGAQSASVVPESSSLIICCIASCFALAACRPRTVRG